MKTILLCLYCLFLCSALSASVTVDKETGTYTVDQYGKNVPFKKQANNPSFIDKTLKQTHKVSLKNQAPHSSKFLYPKR